MCRHLYFILFTYAICRILNTWCFKDLYILTSFSTIFKSWYSFLHICSQFLFNFILSFINSKASSRHSQHSLNTGLTRASVQHFLASFCRQETLNSITQSINQSSNQAITQARGFVLTLNLQFLVFVQIQLTLAN